MYSLLSYAEMASDGVRMDAHARAIARTVRPGDVVVDLGSGTGVLSLLAAKAGARRVHAVETNPAVWLLKDLAAENGLSDRIVIHHGSSFEVELPERADVIVSDLRGSYPLHEQHLRSLRDARERWLAPGGTMIPLRDKLMVAVVEFGSFWRTLERGWTGLERLGFSAQACRSAVVNGMYGDEGEPLMSSAVLTTAAAWAELHYGEAFERAVQSTVELVATRGGIAHALALWFDATLMEGIEFSNAPGQRLVYKRIVLPLYEPVGLAAGDVVAVTVRFDVTGERCAWDTEIRRAAGGPSARFRQATFLGAPTSPEALLRGATAFAPVLSARGQRARRLLDLFDGERTVRQLADEVADGEPPARRDALLEEVRACVQRYAR